MKKLVFLLFLPTLAQAGTHVMNGDAGVSFTAAAASNQIPLTVNQNDTTNNPDAVVVVATGTGRGIYLQHKGHSGNGASSSGAFLMDNTLNDGIGMNLYSNHAAPISGSALLFMKVANPTFNTPAVRIDNLSTNSSAASITLNSTGTADAFQSNQQGTGGNAATLTMSAAGAAGNGLAIVQNAASQTGRGIIITSTGTGNAIQVNVNGFAGGSRKSWTGGVMNINMDNSTSNPDGLVIVSSETDSQAGKAMLRIWTKSPNYNDPHIWIQKEAANSGPSIRIDANTQAKIEFYDTSLYSAGVTGRGAYAIQSGGGNFTLAYRNSGDTSFVHLLDFTAPYDPSSWFGGPEMVLQSTAAIVFNDGSGHAVGLAAPASGITSSNLWRMWTADAVGTVQSDGSRNLSISSTLPATTIFPAKTLAQLQALAPTAAGQVMYCSNCVTDAVCISTGTGAGAWVRTSARGTVCQ